ncbi:MAG: DUF7379 domain-containing protein [Verrucomicrobiota bacterium]
MPPKPKNNKPALQCVSDAWSLMRPAAKPPKSARRAAGAAPKAEAEKWEPDFLKDAGFEILDRARLERAPGRRSVATDTGATIPLKVELDESEAAFVVARQESGAISFHFPQRAVARRSGTTSAVSAVTFNVPVSQSAESGRRGFISKIVKVILVKVKEAVLDKLLEKAAEVAVPFLVKKLEEHLWRARTQGWLRVTQHSLANDKDAMLPGVPSFGPAERGLLLIHGTFSTAHGGFKGLAGTRFFDEAQKLYGTNIFAFNHFTMSKTPEENVKDLLDALPAGDFAFDIITHSRGGLVARELLERSGIAHPHRKRLRVGNVVMVACPSMGTPLASPSGWDEKLSFFANLLEMLPVPENPFTTGAAWLVEALKWVAANVLGNADGLIVMDPAGAFIDDLQDPPDAPRGTAYHALVSNFNPPREWKTRLLDTAADTFFHGANDLVVPTEGGWKTSDTPDGWIDGERVACCGPGGNLHTDLRTALHHGAFFRDAEAVEFILASLKTGQSGLPRVDTQRPLPSRDMFGGRRFTDGVPPTAAPLPQTAAARGAEAAVDKQGFDEERVLYLTVISHTNKATVDDESDVSAPMLLAEYNGARVSVPFYTSGPTSGAGRRWHELIDKQRKIVSYANGHGFLGETDSDELGKIDFPDEKFLTRFGTLLFQTLFPGEVCNLYNIARHQHKKRRLKIVFTSMIPWVADFPWELAYDAVAGAFLACGDVRFVRNVLTSTPSNRLADKSGVLRILVVSAQPSGAGGLSIEEEQRGIRESFRPLLDAGLVEVEVLAGASPQLLHERLRYSADGDDFDVVHFIGHGKFDEATGVGTLLFEDGVGRAKTLGAGDFLNIVRGRGVKIVFLNACETGRGERANYNRGVAMELARDGIPAVVANQYSVIDRSASLFSLNFYACLAAGLSIGDAMREARITLHYDGVEPMDWAVPVLIANNPDARLCRPVRRIAPAGGEPGEAYCILSARTGSRRRGAGDSRISVSVWDAENSLIYRENIEATLAELNAVQDSFAFNLERFTAPRGLWSAKARDDHNGGVAYLNAEKVIGRMERIRKAIGTDFLFCATKLPMGDDEIKNLYYYDQDPEGNLARVCVFSTWAFDPPLEGPLFRKALANHLAIFLLQNLAGPDIGGTSNRDKRHPKHTIGFWNGDREVDHIAGPMTITDATMEELRVAMNLGEFTEKHLVAIQSLLKI